MLMMIDEENNNDVVFNQPTRKTAKTPPSVNPAPNPSEPFDIISLACGIVSLTLCMLPLIGSFLGAAGIILSALANQRSDNAFASHSSSSRLGFVCSMIGTIVNVIFTITTVIIILVFANSLFNLASEAVSSIHNSVFSGFSGLFYFI